MNSLGAKKDVYTGVRCISSGILLGRMAAGLASTERNLENKAHWSPVYAMHFGAESAYKAAELLERIQTTARPQLKRFKTLLDPYKNYGGEGLIKEKAVQALGAAKKDLEEIAQIVVKTCGKRRPADGEGAALVQLKTVKRERAPRVPKNVPMELPVMTAEPSESSSALPLLAAVLMIIGATYFVG